MLNFKQRKHTKRIIIHNSGMSKGRGEDVTTIDRYHREELGYKAVGYHLVITEEGIMQEGRPIDVVGAHTRGYNDDSIGVCYIGKGDPSKAQEYALMIFIMCCLENYPSIDEIRGHNDFADTQCPGFDVSKWVTEFFQKNSPAPLNYTERYNEELNGKEKSVD